jgi:hypothetical protein
MNRRAHNGGGGEDSEKNILENRHLLNCSKNVIIEVIAKVSSVSLRLRSGNSI